MLNSAPTRPSLFYPCILAYFVSNIENPEDVRYYPWEVYYLSLCFAGYWTRTVAEVEGEEGSCPIWIIEIKFIFTDFLKLLWLSVKIPYIVSYDFKFKFYIDELVNLVLFVKIIKLRRVFSTIRDVYMSISLTLTSVSCICDNDHGLCFQSSKLMKKEKWSREQGKEKWWKSNNRFLSAREKFGWENNGQCIPIVTFVFFYFRDKMGLP